MRTHCYRNLNAAKRNMAVFIWSVRVGGKVREHAPSVCLTDVELRVQAGGLKRIRRDTCRNVYAYLVGDRCEVSAVPAHARPLTCNPYREGVFVWGDDRTVAPLRLSAVWLTANGAYGVA